MMQSVRGRFVEESDICELEREGQFGLSEPTTGRGGDAYLKRKDALWAMYLAKVPSVGGVPTNLYIIPNRCTDVSEDSQSDPTAVRLDPRY